MKKTSRDIASSLRQDGWTDFVVDAECKTAGCPSGFVRVTAWNKHKPLPAGGWEWAIGDGRTKCDAFQALSRNIHANRYGFKGSGR